MNREEAARVLSGMRDKLGCVGLIAADEERLTALDSAIDYLLDPDINVARKSPSGAIGPDAGEMAPNGEDGEDKDYADK